MGKIEQKMMGNAWQRFKSENQNKLKDIEKELYLIYQKGVDVLLYEEIFDLKQKVASSPELTSLEPPPKVSPYFVSRENDLVTLKQVLEQYGSAAITGYGGMGKSQLMTVFVTEIKEKEEGPRRVFLITADVDWSAVVNALATFVEERPIAKKDREKPKKSSTADEESLVRYQ